MMVQRVTLWFFCLLGAIFIVVNDGCLKTRPEVTGCMDRVANNFDASATINSGCTYAIDKVAGTYLVVDTSVVFNHNDTVGWYDTTISQFSMKAIAYNHDSLEFDTVLCIHCHAGYKSVAADFSSYYYAMDYYYYTVSGQGSFTGDTFRYREGVSPSSMPGARNRWGVGIKQH